MEYTFQCTKCKKRYIIGIPIERYITDKNIQRCPRCDVLLERVLEWNGPATINGGYESVAGRAKWQ